MKPLRIAFITPFFPLKGGIARFSGHLRDALRDGGYDVVPVAFKALYPGFISKGVVKVEGAHAADVRLVLYNPFSWFGTIRSIRLLHPDILLVAYWTGFLAPFYYLLRRLTGIKIVVLLHNLSSHESFFFDPFMRRLLAAFADGFVTLSKAVFQEVTAVMPAIPVLSLFHPVYEPEVEIPSRHYARRALHLEEECPVLLFFGYVRPYKGLDMLLHAMPAILQREPTLRLVVAGQFFEAPEKFRLLIGQLGMGAVSIFIRGMFPESAPPFFLKPLMLSHFHIAMQPSREWCSLLTVMEYRLLLLRQVLSLKWCVMAKPDGLPVIALLKGLLWRLVNFLTAGRISLWCTEQLRLFARIIPGTLLLLLPVLFLKLKLP